MSLKTDLLILRRQNNANSNLGCAFILLIVTVREFCFILLFSSFLESQDLEPF